MPDHERRLDGAARGASSGEGLAPRLGVFARIFRRAGPVEVARSVAEAGYALAHWNFAAIGRSTLGVDVPVDDVAAVRAAFEREGLAIPSMSGTYNMAHPDPDLRARQTAQAAELISWAPALGADVVTVCTGTRDPDDMWRAHPGNTEPAAWSDLRRSLDPLLDAAASAGVRLGVEPEHGNVVCDAPTAARLLAELDDDAPIGIVLDPANLLTPDTVADQGAIVGEAVSLLGPRIVGVQIKDVVARGYSAAGAGTMDFPALFAGLWTVAAVPVIVQDAAEEDAVRVRLDLLRWYDEAARR